MKAKSIKAFIFIFIFQLISSCCKDVKFYDFNEVKIFSSSMEIGLQDSLVLDIFPVNIEYIGLNFQDFSFNAALAFNCDDVWGGMKYPFKKVEITSSHDFNDNHLAGELLNDLFKIRLQTGYDQFELAPLNMQNEINDGYIQLHLIERPEAEKQHDFTIKFVKLNDEEITIETGEINWE